MIRLFLLSSILISITPFHGDETKPVSKTHAHNDYLHPHPLSDALSFGFVSVEADILLKNQQLFVGHNREDLENKPLLLFETVYLEPLYQRFRQNKGEIYPGYEDLFYLWIDIKYDGEKVYQLLKELVSPYKSMLFSAAGNPQGRVMLIISGDRPYDLIINDPGNYFHLDGRPDDLQKDYSTDKMPFISQNIEQVCVVSPEGSLDTGQWEILRELVKECHRQNKKIRFWATPDNEKMWSQLISADVDLINTDALADLSSFLTK